jgi:hypothetical protein
MRQQKMNDDRVLALYNGIVDGEIASPRAEYIGARLSPPELHMLLRLLQNTIGRMEMTDVQLTTVDHLHLIMAACHRN